MRKRLDIPEGDVLRVIYDYSDPAKKAQALDIIEEMESNEIYLIQWKQLCILNFQIPWWILSLICQKGRYPLEF